MGWLLFLLVGLFRRPRATDYHRKGHWPPYGPDDSGWEG